jgi:hypothetical protein
MKMTVVLSAKGELVAAQYGDARQQGQDAGLVAGPRQTLHILDVPNDVAAMQDPQQFLMSIKSHLPKHQ